MTSSSINMETEERPPIPAVPPLLPEAKLDVSFSFDQIITEMKLDDADIDPKCVSESRLSSSWLVLRGTLRVPRENPSLTAIFSQTFILRCSHSLTYVYRKKEQMEKRQSNVMKLAEENEKLNAELKAMSERIAAAERRTQAILAARERKAKQQLDQINSSEGAHVQHQQQGTSAHAF